MKPDWKAWVAARFSEIQDDDEDEGASAEAKARLATLAGFLESRGLAEELAEAFDEPMEDFAKRDENDFIDFLGTLFAPRNGESRSPSPLYAASFAKEWAGDDRNRWSEIFATALGDNDAVADWVDWIRETDPDIDFPGLSK